MRQLVLNLPLWLTGGLSDCLRLSLSRLIVVLLVKWLPVLACVKYSFVASRVGNYAPAVFP